MSAASNYYSGSYNYENGGSIYVHLHVKNIGRAMGGNAISPGQVISVFRSYKKQALDASKTQFKTLFEGSLDEKSAMLLNEVFNDDDLMTELQKEVGEKLQEALAVDKMRALMEIQKSGIATDKFAQTILKKSKDSIQNFNILLNSLAQAASLLGTESGARLAALLSHENTVNNRKQLGVFLLRALETFQKQNQKVFMTELEIQQAEQIIGNIRSLARSLKTGKLANDKDTLTKSAIRRMIQSIFNTGFAESISAIIKETAYVSLDESFKALLSGGTQVQIEYSNEFGQAVAKSKGRAAYGKADAMFNNVQVRIDSIDKQISINLGISDKFYKTNYFPGLKGNKNKNSYSSGSGGSLVQALWSTFGSNLKYLYYAYNTLGHGNQGNWNEAQSALRDIILTRQIVRLFASRGGNEDFAQYMFVNGQIVPIWNIIISTLDNVSYLKEDLAPASLFIQGEKDIQEIAQKREKILERRIYNVNKAVREAKITTHLNLNNL